MNWVAPVLLWVASAIGQTPSPGLPVIAHRRIPHTYCELLEKGTLFLSDEHPVLELAGSKQILHSSAFSFGLGFVEYDAYGLSGDEIEDIFYAARNAGFQMQTGRPQSALGLPTLEAAKSKPDETCTDLEGARKALDADPVPEHTYNSGTKGITPPRNINETQPSYPVGARSRGIQGDVVLTLIVHDDGQSAHIFVSRSLDPDLDQSAIEAVQRWRFEPALKDGLAVAVVVNVDVHFELTSH